MSKCHKMHERIIEALYDELDEDLKAELTEHLQSCRDCARLYRETAETIRVMDTRETSQRDEEFWTVYSERLTARLEAQESDNKQSSGHKHFDEYSTGNTRHVLRIWAIAALILVGIFLGKLIWTQESPPEHVPPSAVSTPSVTGTEFVSDEDRAQSYLDKSKLLLLALDNFEPQTDNTVTLNLQTQRQISESLVREAAYLKNALNDPAEMRLRELIGDLEIILLQIANLENEHDLEAVEMVQRGVDEQGILFRIDLSKLSKNPVSSSNTKPKAQNQNLI